MNKIVYDMISKFPGMNYLLQATYLVEENLIIYLLPTS